MSTETIERPALNASDRCDRCGAQAYVRAMLEDGFELLFCAHHGREHGSKLKDSNFKIQDESDRIPV